MNVDAFKSTGVHSNIILNDGAATVYAALFESQIMFSLYVNTLLNGRIEKCANAYENESNEPLREHFNRFRRVNICMCNKH